MDALPEVRVSRPAAQCSSVDFPDPDGPMMAVYRPAMNSTVTRSSARTSTSPLPYILTASSVRAAARWPTLAVLGVVMVVIAAPLWPGRRGRIAEYPAR